MSKRLPHICPSCSSPLNVKSLICVSCETEVSGNYNLPLLASLSDEYQVFITNFVKCSGSLKTMAQDLGLSYPTVRNMLDEVIETLRAVEKKTKRS